MPEDDKKKKKSDDDDSDDDFFTAEGVTDEEEKAAIRARARVLAYDRYRQSKVDGKKKKSSDVLPWYKKEA
jgi:hypothetical protein